MSTALNESFSELKQPVHIDVEDEAVEGTHLRHEKFSMRRGHMAVFILTMSLVALDTGYSVQLNTSTMDLVLSLLFPTFDTELGKVCISLTFYVGCVIGCVWGGKHVSYGRRRAIIFSAAFIIAVSLLMMIQSFYVFMIGRFFIGFGSGVKLVAFLRMIEEYCQKKLFKYMANLMYALITLGAVLSATLPVVERNYLRHWRWTFGSNAIANSIILLSMLFFIKCDSPKFYN